ncbi:hypothetical protein THRCLA_00955 [Thraustotheca clavata]|uniref:C2H2-type domain-containing protein n=1 Tax=Thraustotheca clavata TaxID=74557 RepID=A0A1W0A9W2_9STRA|nr:hypothetical protein THRCLA_00955 [Thraustotheca clavata]
MDNPEYHPESNNAETFTGAPVERPARSKSRSVSRGRDRRRSNSPRSRSPPRRRSRSPFRGRRRSNDRMDDRMRRPRGPEPLLSYKAFMMQQNDESSPEVYQQRYEDYKKKYIQGLMRSFFDAHKAEEWLQERYSPAIRHRLTQQKNTKKAAEAKAFFERLSTMKISFNEANMAPEGGETAFKNDLEEGSRILYIRRIPCSCPYAALAEAVKKAGGPIQELHLSDPAKKRDLDFDRSAYIIYDTAAAALEAMPKLQNVLVEDQEMPVPIRLQVAQHRPRAPIKTPSYMSLPNRISYDFQQALHLATLLDNSIFANTMHGITSVLEHVKETNESLSEAAQLDIVIAYLRRVHHFIYYAGVQCIDMGDILHAHPALFCRPDATDRDIEDESAVEHKTFENRNAGLAGWGGWSAALDERIEAHIAAHDPEKLAAKKVAETALVEDIEAREEAALEPVYNSYAEKAGDDGKHRCLLCTKLFKTLEFVKKHIRNKHPELVVDKIAKVGESYMWEQYREDPDRPLPPYDTVNQPTLGGGGPHMMRRPQQDYHRQGGGYRGGPSYGGGDYRGGGGGGYYRDRGGRGGGYSNYNNQPSSYYRPQQPRQFPPRDGPPAPPRDLPVDPRQVSTSYQDLDQIQDKKVELDFDAALTSLPPPKKKQKQ